jgi:dipeptidase E
MFIYISSSPDSYDKTDRYFDFNRKMFEQIGVSFMRCEVLDNRKSQEECKDLLQRGSIIFLSGGNTLSQIKFISDNNLTKDIREHKGIVMGLSAGALNLAEDAVCFAKKERQTTYYDGIGRVNINVEPHFNIDNKEYIRNVISPVSSNRNIYALTDESAIIIRENKVMFMGEIYHISQGVIKKVEESELYKH